MLLYAGQPTDTIPLKYGSHRNGNRTDAAMQHWRGYGLGQFIHWGLYAIPAGKWEGKSYPGAAEWIRSWSGKDAPENWKQTYDQLYKQFNPADFNATKWAKQAADMGAKYLIFTTKHHDGFCLWPSRYTGYTIKNTPYEKDIVKQVVDAYNAVGIDVYLYFSIIDWNHPGYRSAVPDNKQDSLAYESFKTFTRNQLLELLHNYPAIKGFWFDGTWDPAWVKQAEFTDELEKELRKIHPGLIIGSRFRADEYGKRHFDSNGKMMGDYEQGWERKLPASAEVLAGRDWDAVMTIPPNQWGYQSDWGNVYVKNSADLLNMLLHARSMNGNLVVNFGPDASGNIRPEESTIATEMGKWMKQNGDAVYSVHSASLPKPDYGYYTQKDDKLYLSLINIPLNGRLRLAIPKKYPYRLTKPAFLQGKSSLSLKEVDMGMSADLNNYYDIQLPRSLKRQGYPLVLLFELEPVKPVGNNSLNDAKT